MIDEEIIKQKERMEEFERQRFSKETEEEESGQSIFDGEISIHKVPVTFAERTLFSDRVGIWMPEDFEAFTPEMIAAVYLLGNKPDVVFGNSYLNFSVGFHYTEHEVPDAFMGDFPKIVRLVLERSGPKVRIVSEKVRKTEKHTISSLELISHTITDTVYNVMFFCSLDGRVLMGFINFSFQFLDRYKPIAEEMLRSFRFLDEEPDEEARADKMERRSDEGTNEKGEEG